jgi:hypothetical protein
MSWNVPQLRTVGLFPSVEQVELFSEKVKKLLPEITMDSEVKKDDKNVSEVIRLSSLMAKFVDVAQLDGRYFMCDHDDFVVTANWLHTIPLTLPERFIFSSAPVNTKDHMSMNLLYGFTSAYALRRPVAMNIRLSKYKPTDVYSFMDLCSKYNALDLYLWLSYRFPKYFIERDLCLQQREFALNLIEKALFSSNLHQDFSHKSEYVKVREFLLKNYPDGLPPDSFGSIRETTAQFIQDYDPSKLLLYSADNQQSENGASDINHRRVRGNKYSGDRSRGYQNRGNYRIASKQ